MRLYRALAAFALAAYAPFAIVRSLTGGRRLGDLRGRLGRRPYPRLAGGIWIHAVSVGEIGVARNLLRALRRRLPDPACPIGISVTTAAGRELARRPPPCGLRRASFAAAGRELIAPPPPRRAPRPRAGRA